MKLALSKSLTLTWMKGFIVNNLSYHIYKESIVLYYEFGNDGSVVKHLKIYY